MLENLTYLKPEIFLSITSMALLMYGVFNRDNENITRNIFAISIAALAITIYIICLLSGTPEKISALGGGFVFDDFSAFIKIFISAITIGIFIISINSPSYAGSNRNVFEFPVLMLLAVTGMFLLASANDLLAFYIGLELQSLALYVLVAINRDSETSTESAVKYFVLGALASGIILFGASLIYGFAGSTGLDAIAALISGNHEAGIVSTGVIFGLVLIFAGLFFKLSAAPMHMWAPDVYQGATKPVLAFIATAPKVAALAFLIRLVSMIKPEIFLPFGKIIIFVSAASMIIGSFAALRQDNIKRLLAYSSVGNMGYMLIAVAIGTQAAMQAGLIYLLIYITGSIGIFAIVSLISKQGKELEMISDLSGMAKSNPVIAAILAIFMFSIAGIPPMAGFFGKFFVFREAVAAGMIILAVIGVITSVVACFYYLRIIKTMYFDEKNSGRDDITVSIGLKILLAVTTGFTMLLIFFTHDVIELANQATLSIF